MTIGELCQQQGYATACFGKWHLGHHPKFLPLQHGFDEYLGLPYSNDMWPWHPNYAGLAPDDRRTPARLSGSAADRREQGCRPGSDGRGPAQLTTMYTERAVQFIDRNRDKPFFLYVPHSMVHVPLYVSDKFQGKSQRGLFGDVVMEVDWSVGQILEAIARNGLDENTLVVFTADNGPWLSYGDHAGSAGPLREGKGTEFEGGIREPTLMRWPGRIPAGSVCDELASTIDMLPTIAALIGAQLPEHKIDGQDIRPLMFGAAGAQSPHESFYCYYSGGELQAVRDRRWKLHFPHSYRTLAGRPGGKDGLPAQYQQDKIGLELFDLKNDVGETTNVAAAHPEVVERLQACAQRARDDLGDKLTKAKGAGIRGPGHLEPQDERLEW